MTSDFRPINEEDLHAYVDGFLDAERRAQVERCFAVHPDVAARIRAWQAGRAALRDALAWKASEPVPASLSLAELMRLRAARRIGVGLLAASVVLALAIGGVAGWVLRGPGGATGVVAVAQEAVIAHRLLLSGIPPATPEAREGDAAGIATWARSVLGDAVRPPDLSAAGYRLTGGRLVPTGDGLGGVFLYGGGNGNRLTVFMRRMRDGTVSSPMREMGDAPGYAWVSDGVGVSLISDQAMSGLHGLANTIRSEM
jgi:anti-sigma factor RsiW